MFEEHVAKLDKVKPVIICGDMNVAHNEIGKLSACRIRWRQQFQICAISFYLDLANPKTNTKNAGFTKEEREGMSRLLSMGYTDAFRHLYPSQKAYSFWSYMGNARAKDVGWRLDYFINSERINSSVVDCFMRSAVLGSDHCPINLLLNI